MLHAKKPGQPLHTDISIIMKIAVFLVVAFELILFAQSLPPKHDLGGEGNSDEITYISSSNQI
jgi:hypothetical protein